MSAALWVPRASALVAVTTVVSPNWSGYVATDPSPYTYVSGTWTVPPVSTDSAPAYSSVWVGIGGWDSSSDRLIQVGTDQDVLSNGTAVYYAWRELYPNPPAFIAFVSPGDSITATVSQLSANSSTWSMLVTRNSDILLDTAIRARVNSASENSAEFILERPAIQLGRTEQLTTLANFGSVTFAKCVTNQGTLASLADAVNIIMSDNETGSRAYLAQPGSIDSSTNSFNVRYGLVLVPVSEFPSIVVVAVVLILTIVWLDVIARRRMKDR